MPEPLLLDRLLLVSHLFHRDMARAFAGTELTEARMTVLWMLHHTGPVTQQALAAALEVTPRNVSAHIDSLETAGFVERQPHPTDRRAHLVRLTSVGEQLMERTAREHAELSDTLRRAVAPEDREALERGLDAVTRRLEQLMAEAAGTDTDTNTTGTADTTTPTTAASVPDTSP